MEKEIVGNKKDVKFTRRARKFVQDKILDADIVDNFVVGSILGSAFVLQEYIASRFSRKKKHK